MVAYAYSTIVTCHWCGSTLCNHGTVNSGPTSSYNTNGGTWFIASYPERGLSDAELDKKYLHYPFRDPIRIAAAPVTRRFGVDKSSVLLDPPHGPRPVIPALKWPWRLSSRPQRARAPPELLASRTGWVRMRHDIVPISPF